MEAGSIGEAKFDWTSCLTGGLNTWGVRPMSVMWGLDTEGGIWGAIIVFKKFGNYVEVNQMSVHLKFFIRQFSVFILIREAEHFLDVRLGHFPGDAVEMNHFGGGQDPVLPRHLLGVEPVQPPVTQVILH